MSLSPVPARHWLAWPRSWPENLPDAAQRWLAAGRPAVVCRDEPPERDAGPHPPTIRLGLALPSTLARGGPLEKPGRCAWGSQPAAILRTCPPMRLAEALPFAPAGEWRRTLDTLCRAGQAHGIEWEVFGSLAWQALGDGGFPFFDPFRSDVDLLFTPVTAAQLDAGVALLQSAAQRGPGSLDGEILFPDDCAVSWREWVTRPRQVLVKRRQEVALRSPGELVRSLEGTALPSALWRVSVP